MLNLISNKNTNDKIKDCNINKIMSNGLLLEFIPDAEKTDDLILLAIKQNVYALKFVPNEKKSRNIINNVLFELSKIKSLSKYNENNISESILEFIPENFYDNWLINIVFMAERNVLKNLSDSKKTDYIIKKSVETDGLSLEFVPEHKKTKEICNIALTNNPLAIKFISKKLNLNYIE